MFNRIWQHNFGKPIVATPSDFGLRGAPPTHPLLLDWLAGEFVRRGWSIKAMHRTIMLSQTYQRDASHDAANAQKDAGNTWYWRFDRRRLDAEAIRDSMLALSGRLDLDRPGPHPFPPKDKWRFSAHRQFKAVYPSNHRSVYLMVQRLHPHPYLSMFNGPDTSMSTPMRDRSTVAKQALFMLNSDFVHEQADGLAQRLIAAADEPRARVRLAFERVLARPATDREVDRTLAHLDAYASALTSEGVAADKVERQAWASLARVLLTSNAFLYVD